jgi:hypothetical protein
MKSRCSCVTNATITTSRFPRAPYHRKPEDRVSVATQPHPRRRFSRRRWIFHSRRRTPRRNSSGDSRGNASGMRPKKNLARARFGRKDLRLAKRKRKHLAIFPLRCASVSSRELGRLANFEHARFVVDLTTGLRVIRSESVEDFRGYPMRGALGCTAIDINPQVEEVFAVRRESRAVFVFHCVYRSTNICQRSPR